MLLYVYWDYSNIYIEAQNIAAATEKERYGDDVSYRLRLDFHNLMRLVRRDRAITKAVAAGSVPPEMREVWVQLEKEGVQTQILDRRTTGGSECDLPDVKLQWEMFRDALRSPRPGTVALMTGDGSGWAHDKGFLPTLQTIREKNWKVEVASWEHSCNRYLKE